MVNRINVIEKEALEIICVDVYQRNFLLLPFGDIVKLRKDFFIAGKFSFC